MTAETSNARGEWPARYACNGPEGTFWADDATLANKLIAAAFDRDEWTVTDTQNPTAAAPAPPSAPVGVEAVRGAWLAAITLANNICVQESDRENDRDGDTGWIDGTAKCAKRIREYAHPTDAELLEMLDEAGANSAKAALSQQPVAVDETMLERACRHWYSRWDEADQATKMLWAEMMYDLLAAALAPPPADPRATSEQAITEALRREREELRYE